MVKDKTEKAPEVMTVAWMISMASDGTFYAERVTFAESAIVSRTKRHGAGIAHASELARMDMARVSRELWDKAWSRKRAAEFATIDADNLVMSRLRQQAPPDFAGQLEALDARIAVKQSQIDNAPSAKEVEGWVQFPDIDPTTKKPRRMLDKNVPPEKRFLASPIDTKEMFQPQMDDLLNLREACVQEQLNYVDGSAVAETQADASMTAALKKAADLSAEAKRRQTEEVAKAAAASWAMG